MSVRWDSIAGHLDLVDALLDPLLRDRLVARDVAKAHAPIDRVTEHGARHRPDHRAVTPDRLSVIGERLRVVEDELHKPPPHPSLTLAQERIAPDEAACLLPG